MRLKHRQINTIKEYGGIFIGSLICAIAFVLFIIVSDAYDAYGERWNHLPEPGDLVMR